MKTSITKFAKRLLRSVLFSTIYIILGWVILSYLGWADGVYDTMSFQENMNIYLKFSKIGIPSLLYVFDRNHIGFWKSLGHVRADGADPGWA